MVTDASVIQRVQGLAKQMPDHQIADALNADGTPTRTGKSWTYRRVVSLRKQHHIPTACPVSPGLSPTRADGFVSAAYAAKCLNVSDSLIHYWVKHGVMLADQRTYQSFRWVRFTNEDIIRLNGSGDWSHLPTLRTVAQLNNCTAKDIWERVRQGQYVPYRQRLGQSWEWRLMAHDALPKPCILSGQQCD